MKRVVFPEDSDVSLGSSVVVRAGDSEPRGKHGHLRLVAVQLVFLAVVARPFLLTTTRHVRLLKGYIDGVARCTIMLKCMACQHLLSHRSITLSVIDEYVRRDDLQVVHDLFLKGGGFDVEGGRQQDPSTTVFQHAETDEKDVHARLTMLVAFAYVPPRGHKATQAAPEPGDFGHREVGELQHTLRADILKHVEDGVVGVLVVVAVGQRVVMCQARLLTRSSSSSCSCMMPWRALRLAAAASSVQAGGVERVGGDPEARRSGGSCGEGLDRREPWVFFNRWDFE
ncbi:hypothetical protein ON010_g18739 [Phytophthora cinnamomi]|nr:hypothetical protein ON010_g18739 [Phytophthora cinnamomi]